jgi:hypothetical protein
LMMDAHQSGTIFFAGGAPTSGPGVGTLQWPGYPCHCRSSEPPKFQQWRLPAPSPVAESG